MSVKISELSAVTTPLGGTEIIACVQTTTKKVTTAELAAYAMDVMVAAATATPTTGDYLVGARGTDEKRMTLDAVSAYAVASAWSVAAATTAPTAGDYVLVYQGSTTKKATLANVITLVLDGVQADVLDISALSAATLGATDQYLVVQGTTAKKTTLADIETKLWTDYGTYVAALPAVTTSVDADVFYCIQGGNAKYVTASVLATYMLAEIKAAVVDSAWDGALVDPISTSDVFVLQRSGVQKTAYGYTFVTYIDSVFAASTQVTPLLTGDLLLLYRGGVRKTATIDAITTYVTSAAWTASEVTSGLSTDVMLLQRSGVAKTITLDHLRSSLSVLESSEGWEIIPTSYYTATPASTSRITFNDTSGITVRRPIRYKYGGQPYYALIVDAAVNQYIDIVGAPLDTGDSITELCIGPPERVVQVNFIISGWIDAVHDVLADPGLQYFCWQGPSARLVHFGVTLGAPDSGAAQPKINVKIDDVSVSTSDSNKGVQCSATAGQWVMNSAVAVNAANTIAEPDPIHIQCTEAGTNGDAAALSVTLVFVLA